MQVFAAWFSAPPPKPLKLVERHGVSMDLFDARHLLEQQRPVASNGGSRLDASLNGDRFSDLWDAQDRLRDEETQRKRQKHEQEAPKAADEVTVSAATPVAIALAPFDVPYEVPAGMAVPATEKQHSVIWTLVSFVLKQGKSVIQSVKTRQSDNPLFAFLNPDHNLHPYFEHLLCAAEASTLRDAPHVRFWREIPPLGRAGLAALLGSEEAVQRQIVEKLASFVKEYGPEVVPKIVRSAPSPDERRLDFLAPDNPLHELYSSLVGPPPSQPKSEEELAERRRRAAALIQAAGL